MNRATPTLDPQFQSALAAQRAGQTALAEQGLRGVLEREPDHVEARYQLAVILQQRGQARDAALAYRRVLELRPDHAQAHNNLGNLFADAKQFAQAEAAYRRAVEFKPDYALAFNNLGALLAEARRHEEAEQAYRRAIEIQPDYAQAHSNLGVLLKRVSRFAEAEAAYRRALDLDPQDAGAYNNLGNLLRDADRLPEAWAAFASAVRLRPDLRNPRVQIPFVRRCLAAWSSIEDDDALLIQTLATGVPADISPSQLLSMPALGPSGLREAGRLYAQARFAAELARPPLVDPALHRVRSRLRIGYGSADFYTHPVGLLLAGVLEKHDRARFDIRLYSFGPASQDATRQRITAACEQFVDLQGASDAEAAQRIANDELDLLIDLGGYTGNHRAGVVARRPAPVIVNWLGYPGSMGHPRMADYFISDAIRTPAGFSQDFSETLALMPHSSQPNDDSLTIGAKPTREEAGLPVDAVVFCSFNQCYKITREMFHLWCRLLLEVPGSVLWLQRMHPVAMDNLRREALGLGVAPERLVFAAKQPLTQHLGRLQLADLALDTLPYNSGATASNVLWAGVPLITRIGRTYVGRMAASLLHAVGLPELVTDSNEAYFALAKALALDATRRLALREKLAAQRLTAPLFDTPRFTRDLEALYLRIWGQHGERKRATIVSAAQA